MTTRHRLGFGLTIAAALVSGISVFTVAAQRRAPATSPPARSPQGQTTTMLPDGRWLLLGGATSGGVSRAATIVDPSTGASSVLRTTMRVPRAGHSATLLPDGTALILGGRDALGQFADVAELFDPATGTFMPIAFEGSTARAGHSATLLTDGRVLVAGGTNAVGAVADVEAWDVHGQRVAAAGQLLAPRSGQDATLLADGRVALTGGVDAAGRPIAQPEIFDPAARQAVPASAPVDDGSPAHVTGSVPANGAVDVAVDARLALRISRPLRAGMVTAATVRVDGEEGPVEALVVPAEGGRLVFVTPRLPLRERARYTLTIDGIPDVTARPLVGAAVSFTTAASPDPATSETDNEAWVPDPRLREHGWRTNRPASPWESLPPLMAAPGTTAISGRVLTLDGRPLAGVSLSVEGDGEVQSDRTGRFLLQLKNSATARRVLRIDGAPASKPHRRYGFFEYGMTVQGGMTNVLPFTIWQPKLDTAHEITIPSPTTSEVVVTTPYIPGLELHLPPGTRIRGEDGKPVTTLSITPIPIDRPPFPLPKNVEVPVYFTVQPGGGYVYTPGPGPRGAWLVYPNYTHLVPRQRVQFFHYDPDVNDWYVYGLGRANAVQVVPDATTRLYEFTGAMINGGGSPPDDGPPPGDCCADGGDPVNLATGLFTLETTDLYLPDLIPIGLTRTYRQRDEQPRPFGVGTTHPYAMFLYDSGGAYQQADLILPDGGRVHYVRITPGGGWVQAVLVHQETASTAATPTAFYKSTMRWNGNGWDITTVDGTVYVFGENAPLQAIRDRHGNQVTILHANGQTGDVTQVISPNGRWIKFSYQDGRVSEVSDNIGRTVSYAYDAAGNLSSVTDPESHVTTYTYDSAHRMLTVKPPNLQGTQQALVTNEYDLTGTPETNPTFGWVKKQTHVDDGVFLFAYTFQNGKIANTLVTDPRGKKHRVTFNQDRYSVAHTFAVDEPEQQEETSDRPARNNFVTSSVDTGGDVTATDYDELGRVRSVTRLPGTPDEAVTTYTYDPVWPSEIATITDALQHTTTYEYDEHGNRKSVIDALGHKTSYLFNASGQVTSVTDALQHTTTYEYAGPDLVKITNPLGRVIERFYDAAGRALSETDPAGQTTRFAYDKLNHVTQVTDPRGGTTTYGYDTAGRLGTVADALNHATTYGYDAFNRLASRTDPLSNVERFTYDLNGRLAQRTDRKGQVTTRTYDSLNRLQQIAYADNSTITYTYDSGNRLRVIDDSSSGADVTRDYDDLDRLISETTPQGTVSYTYDKADRRATMTVAGQLAVTYGYDAANRLTSITQGSATVTIGYDNANRRTTSTLPNGVVTAYGYNNADQLTSLTYTLEGTTLGTLTYDYDLAGRRIEVGGTWARTGLPRAVATAQYDAANRLLQWAGASFSYDRNGNLASDGPTSYSWNARDQLAALAGGHTATFGYDGAQRRISRSMSTQTSTFLYDQDNVVQESAGALGQTTLLNGLQMDETYMRSAGGTEHGILTDGGGSTLALVNAAGAAASAYTYEPFGAGSQSGASVPYAWQFGGRENDGDLYYFRARYYLAPAGRFLSEDPASSDPHANHYAYVANDPINNSDPLGLYTVTTKDRILSAQVDSAMDLIRKELEKKSGCKCVDYFKDLDVTVKTWASKGGPPYISTRTDLAGDIGGIAQNGAPWTYMWLNTNRAITERMNPCTLGSILLHEMGHLARKDTKDNEPNDFFNKCRMGCIAPGSWR
ncbi:MAG TPA: RHS repeat-associated core domain-containing protein [Vicinamibacterales bacterium]|nr:RHS repeat-associated core domain-containing protein [Vicinamibacterales bacterium]